MNSQHRSKLSYYKQIYNFECLIAQFAHPSWLTDIQVPAKIINHPHKTLVFQSSIMLQKLQHFKQKSVEEPPLFLFLASLSKTKFKHFLDYLVLSFLKNDKSLLINGMKLKKIANFFSHEQVDFLLHEKEVKIKLTKPFSLPKDTELNEAFFVELSFHLLREFFEKNSFLFEKIKFRFPKEVVENKKWLYFSLDAQANMPCLHIIAQALFPALYSVFELDGNLIPEQLKNQGDNSLENFENAYKVAAVNP